MANTLALIKRLHDGGVEFIIIGGVAAIAYGGSTTTDDLDVCAPLSHENAIRIIRSLDDLHPRWRTRPDLPVIQADSPHLRNLKNMYLLTDLGKIDILSELPGVCSCTELTRRCVEVDFEGTRCRMVDLETLIEAKRVANRDKDRATLKHLEVIKKHRDQNPGLFDDLQ